jgi:branched-chain amino acid transport system permease protein
MYKVDAERDRQYIEEFRQTPIGAHSPGLQRVLNTMRYDPSGWQIILVCRRPFNKWVIGLMPPRRSDPIQIEDGRFFSSREEAEWEVFRRRWRLHTGQEINTPFRGD